MKGHKDDKIVQIKFFPIRLCTIPRALSRFCLKWSFAFEVVSEQKKSIIAEQSAKNEKNINCLINIGPNLLLY